MCTFVYDLLLKCIQIKKVVIKIQNILIKRDYIFKLKYLYKKIESLLSKLDVCIFSLMKKKLYIWREN